jgi:hypothetical protein
MIGSKQVRFGLRVVLLFVFSSFLTSSLWAVQIGVIQGDGIQVLSSPEITSSTIESLRNGQKVYSSDQATSGFYKVKTPSGKIGWVSQEALTFEAGGRLKPQKQRQDQGRRKSEEYSDESTGDRIDTRIRAGWNMTMYTLTQLNTDLGITGGSSTFKNGTGWSLEGAFASGEKTRFLVRAETISQTVNIAFASTLGTVNADCTASSLPLMAGLEYRLGSGGSQFEATLAGLVGAGLSTKVNLVTPELSSPNETTFSGTVLPTALVRLQGEYLLGDRFALNGYLGYRYLKLSARSASPTGRLSDLNADGSADSREFNFSGVALGLGVGLRF